MKRSIIAGSALLLLSAASAAMAGPGHGSAPGIPKLLSGAPMHAEDFGAPGGAQSAAMAGQLVAKWGKVMRTIRGWNEAAVEQFRAGYSNYPVSVMEQALAATTFEDMSATLDKYATLQTQRVMSKAFALGGTRPEDADDPKVAEAKQLVAKTLGDAARDLTFIPVTPCTVWDTRFATDPNAAGVISSGVTKTFYSHLSGSGTSYSTWGGNPSCAETSQNFLGGRPYAVMMTVYINNASANGWLTLYRNGDVDPSQSTVSVYYSPGPTRTQTVISKSNRGWGVAADYDIAATSRFATTDAAASVTGYFMKATSPTTLSFDAPVGTVPVYDGSFHFVGSTQSVTLTSNASRITGSITAVLGATGGPLTVDMGLCYQGSGGGGVNPMPDFYTAEVGTDRRAYNASATMTNLTPGTYTVGYCVFNLSGSVILNNNDWAIGWVRVEN